MRKRLRRLFILLFVLAVPFPAWSQYSDQETVGTIYGNKTGQPVTVTIPETWTDYYDTHYGEGGFEWSTSGTGVSLGYEAYPKQATSRSVYIDLGTLSSNAEVRCRFMYHLGGQYGTLWWTTLIWKVERPESINVESVTLNETSISLQVNETCQLSATVSPGNADNLGVRWSSSNTTVATVNSYGRVTAVKAGQAKITCEALDQTNNAKATCNVTVTGGGDWSSSGNYDISWYNKNQTEFTLTTARELAGMAYLVNNGYTNFYGTTIKLEDDINLSGKDWIPCGEFCGKFDGQGHVIEGMVINVTNYNSTDERHIGFWRIIKGASITNLSLRGSISVTLNQEISPRIGGLIGSTTGMCSVENCNIEVDIACQQNPTWGGAGEDCIGGIVGAQEGTFMGNKVTVRYCKHKGNFDCNIAYYGADRLYVGGIVGSRGGAEGALVEFCENESSLIHIKDNYGNANPANRKIGGICGYGFGRCCRSIIDKVQITNNRNTKDKMVNSTNYYFCGIDTGGDPINCYSVLSTIEISSTSNSYVNAYIGGVSTSGGTACFSNSDMISDVNIVRSVENLFDGSTSFSSAQMQTPAFLEELNMYSMLEMDDGPVWTQPAEGGYPYIGALYESSGVGRVLVDDDGKAAPVYSLSGQRLAAPRRGVNIIGGKKVVIK